MTRARRGERGTAQNWRELRHALHDPLPFGRTLVGRVGEDDVLTAAAALAYYFFLALFPLVIFVLALASVLPLGGLQPWLLETANRSLPANASRLVETVVENLFARPRGGLLSIGALVALWTASAAFGAVMKALNRAYRVRDERPWWRARLHAVGLTLGLSALMIVAFLLTLFGNLAVGWIGATFGPIAGTAALVARWVVTIAAVVLVVAAIYYAAPAVEKDWQWIGPGSVVFVLGFAACSAAFSWYVASFGSYDRTYGSLGAVIVLLVWMYLLGFFLLIGGELNALLERRVMATAWPEAAAPPLDETRRDDARRAHA